MIGALLLVWDYSLLCGKVSLLKDIHFNYYESSHCCKKRYVSCTLQNTIICVHAITCFVDVPTLKSKYLCSFHSHMQCVTWNSYLLSASTRDAQICGYIYNQSGWMGFTNVYSMNNGVLQYKCIESTLVACVCSYRRK